MPACALKGLGMVVWSPLAGGYLSGKYQPGEHSVAGSRSAENWAFPTRFFHPDHQAILAELLAVARELGRSPAQVAVRWVLEQPHGCQRHRRCQDGRATLRHARRDWLAIARSRLATGSTRFRPCRIAIPARWRKRWRGGVIRQCECQRAGDRPPEQRTGEPSRPSLYRKPMDNQGTAATITSATTRAKIYGQIRHSASSGEILPIAQAP